MDISIPYYEDKTRISNSNIGWFLNKGPAYLYKMLNEDCEGETGSQLERGTMIHEYLLQPEEFLKDYVLWDKCRPSSSQEEKFCQALAFSTEIEPNRAILDAFKQAYSTTGKSEDFMLSTGLKKASALKDYIDFLKSMDKRKMITPYDYQMLKNIKNNIDAHKLASKLLANRTTELPETFLTKLKENGYQRDAETLAVYHEFHINWEFDLDHIHVLCKSLLDGLILDFKNKRATIFDLKTTVKLWHFEESMQSYDYLRQLSFYMLAVQWYLKEECNEYAGEWDFDFYIIGIDTTGSYEIRVFKFNLRDMESSVTKITKAMRDIEWHLSTNNWEHSRCYYEGDGSESLNL